MAPAFPSRSASGCSRPSRVPHGRGARALAWPSPPNWCAPMAATFILQSSTEAGTCFVITIPDQVTQLRPGRTGERKISLKA